MSGETGNWLDSANRFRPGTPISVRLALRSAPQQDGCVLWTGTLDVDGYGWFRCDGVNLKAHRVAYELHVGPIPDGLHIDHLCHVRACVNPEHLEAVTPTVNQNRSHVLTKCKRGHDWAVTPPYTWVNKYGVCRRRCSECQKTAIRQRRALRRAERDAA